MFIEACEGKQNRHVICHQHNCKRNLFLGLPIMQAIMRRTKKITQTCSSKYLSEDHNVN